MKEEFEDMDASSGDVCVGKWLVEPESGSVWAAVEGRGDVELSGDDEGGIGGSETMDRRVSAATMPPMECPTKTTRTDGSIVGEGVEAETSRSMTLFWSLWWWKEQR